MRFESGDIYDNHLWNKGLSDGDCKILTLRELRRTRLYKSIPSRNHRKSTLGKPELCQLLTQYNKMIYDDDDQPGADNDKFWEIQELVSRIEDLKKKLKKYRRRIKVEQNQRREKDQDNILLQQTLQDIQTELHDVQTTYNTTKLSVSRDYQTQIDQLESSIDKYQVDMITNNDKIREMEHMLETQTKPHIGDHLRASMNWIRIRSTNMHNNTFHQEPNSTYPPGPMDVLTHTKTKIIGKGASSIVVSFGKGYYHLGVDDGHGDKETVDECVGSRLWDMVVVPCHSGFFMSPGGWSKMEAPIERILDRTGYASPENIRTFFQTYIGESHRTWSMLESARNCIMRTQSNTTNIDNRDNRDMFVTSFVENELHSHDCEMKQEVCFSAMKIMYIMKKLKKPNHVEKRAWEHYYIHHLKKRHAEYQRDNRRITYIRIQMRLESTSYSNIYQRMSKTDTYSLVEPDKTYPIQTIVKNRHTGHWSIRNGKNKELFFLKNASDYREDILFHTNWISRSNTSTDSIVLSPLSFSDWVTHIKREPLLNTTIFRLQQKGTDIYKTTALVRAMEAGTWTDPSPIELAAYHWMSVMPSDCMKGLSNSAPPIPNTIIGTVRTICQYLKPKDRYHILRDITEYFKMSCTYGIMSPPSQLHQNRHLRIRATEKLYSRLSWSKIIETTDPHCDKWFKSALFKIYWSIFCAQQTMGSYRHNDLHTGNVVTTRVPSHKDTVDVFHLDDERTYYIPLTPIDGEYIQPIIIDYGHTDTTVVHDKFRHRNRMKNISYLYGMRPVGTTHGKDDYIYDLLIFIRTIYKHHGDALSTEIKNHFRRILGSYLLEYEHGGKYNTQYPERFSYVKFIDEHNNHEQTKTYQEFNRLSKLGPDVWTQHVFNDELFREYLQDTSVPVDDTDRVWMVPKY